MKKMISLLFIILSIASCSKNVSDEITVVATTNFVTDTVKIIAGDKILVTGLIKSGQDPHTYDPSPRDIALVEKASIIFVNGFDLEEGLMIILNNVNRDKIVELSQNITPTGADEADHDEHHHEVDPHTWMSPLNVIKWVETATDALIQISPENEKYFTENSKSYINDLTNLHTDILKKVSTIENEKRILVTDHASFGYFARDYDFTIKGTLLPGFSSNSDTTSKEIINLIKLINEEKIPAIFVGETSGNDIIKLSDNIQAETGSTLKIIPLKTGSLDPAGTGADTYIKYMQYNTDQIIRGLSE